jgi:hypothetical protein
MRHALPSVPFCALRWGVCAELPHSLYWESVSSWRCPPPCCPGVFSSRALLPFLVRGMPTANCLVKMMRGHVMAGIRRSRSLSMTCTCKGTIGQAQPLALHVCRFILNSTLFVSFMAREPPKGINPRPPAACAGNRICKAAGGAFLPYQLSQYLQMAQDRLAYKDLKKHVAKGTVAY